MEYSKQSGGEQLLKYPMVEHCYSQILILRITILENMLN